jgi:hypothetical protein
MGAERARWHCPLHVGPRSEAAVAVSLGANHRSFAPIQIDPLSVDLNPGRGTRPSHNAVASDTWPGRSAPQGSALRLLEGSPQCLSGPPDGRSGRVGLADDSPPEL